MGMDRKKGLPAGKRVGMRLGMRRKNNQLNWKKAMRSLLRAVAGIAMIAFLAAALNFFFLGIALVQYMKLTPDSIGKRDIVPEMYVAKQGYELSGGMQETLRENGNWLMLLNADGQVIWEFDKPDGLADSYSRADIARMAKWYLDGYPVYMYLWEDNILVIGYPRDTLWKYNIEFSLSWIDFIKEVWLYFLAINFIWIVGLAFFLHRRWTRSKEQARLEWIAGISHDIRTPLSLVMGYADMLERDPELSAEERQQAAVMKRQSIVMKELIEDLNLTSQLEYSMEALRKSVVSPAAVLREVAASFLNDIGEERLQIQLEIGEGAEHIVLKADRRLLVRAFRNLINNSLQHGGQEACVHILIAMWQKRHSCHIRFEDNGAGYSGEVLRSLMNPKKKDTDWHIRGLGIVRKVIRAHGGRIVFGNLPQGGGFSEIRLRISRRMPAVRDCGGTASGYSRMSV